MMEHEKEAGTGATDAEIQQVTDQTPEKIENPKPDRAPDGGLAAWIVVLGAWCTSFCSYGWLNSMGVFQDYYQTALLKQYSASEIAWIPSLQIFFIMAAGPFIGWLYDRYGPRYIIFAGTFCHVFGLMMVSISKEYYQIMLAQGVCSAIGASLVYQPALTAVGSWFDKRRALAFGILSTGSSTGGVIFPIMVNHLIRKAGYGWALRISAFLILFLLVIANLTVRCWLPPKKQPLSKEDLLRPLGELGTVLVLAGLVFMTFGIFIPINYLIVQATAGGMSPSLSQYLVPILNAASVFGRFGGGLIGDKIGRYNMYIIICYFSGVITLALWLPATGNAAIIVFAALFGFSSGGFVSLSPALIAQISPYKELGYRLGLVYFFASIAGVTTNPIAGAILQRSSGSFNNVKIYAGVCCLVGTTFVLVARIVHTGPKFAVQF